LGWLTTTDLEDFRAIAGGYLRSREGDGTLLLRAARSLRGDQPLFGWWAPPGGADVRGAFLHDPPAPLLVVGRVPEFAAALAAALHQARRPVCGVDAAPEAADAFAAAWTQRTGLATRLHRHVKVYRMTGAAQYREGPAGRARPATPDDRELLVDWLRACGTEAGGFSLNPEDLADDLISYQGAIFWEADGEVVALAALTRPVEQAVRIAIVYTPSAVRHRGYAAAASVAASRAALCRPDVSEVLLISDRPSPVRRAQGLGYELASERVQLSFGPATGPMPRLTGPFARLRRLFSRGTNTNPPDPLTLQPPAVTSGCAARRSLRFAPGPHGLARSALVLARWRSLRRVASVPRTARCSLQASLAGARCASRPPFLSGVQAAGPSPGIARCRVPGSETRRACLRLP
jgi:hypothetical protein